MSSPSTVRQPLTSSEDSACQWHPILAAIVALVLLLLPSLVFSQPEPQRNSGRDCATCHLEWVEAFDRPGATLLIDRPAKPMVVESSTCLGCHDGSVGDARKQVWLIKGHRAGEKLPADMKAPAGLPLDDGKVTCRTCHTAHAGTGPENLANVVFLRVPKGAGASGGASGGDLCQACHTDKARGPEQGSHPLGEMKVTAPDDLLAAGGHAGASKKNLLCQSCHTAHGAREDHLLVLGTQSSQLCVTCHAKVKPGMFQPGDNPGAKHEHPQNPPAKPIHQAAIKDMGTHLGADSKLVCLSCHKVHGGMSGRFMLADTLADSHLCLRCHPERKDMIGSAHDLRKTAPAERNKLAQTPEQSGPCGACHSFHQYARTPEPSLAAGDPTGLCITCHKPSFEFRVSSFELGPATPALNPKPETRNPKPLLLAHPGDISGKPLPADLKLALYAPEDQPQKKSLACLTCHDPHYTRRPKFLRTDTDSLCSSCHPKQWNTLAGGHDFTQQPALQNGRAMTGEETGKCAFCHDVHQATGPMLWVATRAAPQQPDDLCVSCHQAGGLASKKPAAPLSHPTGPKVAAKMKDLAASADATMKANAGTAAGLPLFDARGHMTSDGFVACSSCHDPHGDTTKSAALLRGAGNASALCTTCHAAKLAMTGGRHDPKAPPPPAPTEAAKPKIEDGPKPLLGGSMARQVRADEPVKAPPATWPEPAAKQSDLCLSCHQAHSHDPARGLWTVAASGAATSAAAGDRTCLACHPAQQWLPKGEKPRLGATLHPQDLSKAHVSAAAAPQLETRNHPGAKLETLACRTCHDPHLPATSLHLIRGSDRGRAAEMCVECHANARALEQSMHAEVALYPDHPKEERACGPCHAVHALKQSNPAKLWAVAPAPEGLNDYEKHCLACHAQRALGTSATRRMTLVRHPQAVLRTPGTPGTPGVPGIPGTQPADQATTQPATAPADTPGTPAAPGHLAHAPTVTPAALAALPAGFDASQITCATCHLPHGPGDVGITPPPPKQALSFGQLRLTKPMLKPNVARDLCSTCHGYDAMTLFLYFHQPAKRAGLVKPK